MYIFKINLNVNVWDYTETLCKIDRQRERRHVVVSFIVFPLAYKSGVFRAPDAAGLSAGPPHASLASDQAPEIRPGPERTPLWLPPTVPDKYILPNLCLIHTSM